MFLKSKAFSLVILDSALSLILQICSERSLDIKNLKDAVLTSFSC